MGLLFGLLWFVSFGGYGRCFCLGDFAFSSFDTEFPWFKSRCGFPVGATIQAPERPVGGNRLPFGLQAIDQMACPGNNDQHLRFLLGVNLTHTHLGTSQGTAVLFPRAGRVQVLTHSQMINETPYLSNGGSFLSRLRGGCFFL